MEVTDQTFQKEVIDRSYDELVIVDFWASWCAPCRALMPNLEAVCSREGITLAKINVDENQVTPPAYGVKGIPAVMVFKDGDVVDSFAGNMPMGRLNSFVGAQKVNE